MSEYWVSKKKYFCKYCDIYIADDAPSRQQHENGLRHKGSVERFIRGIYKQGEKQKKDKEEEIREMKRVEQLAAAAFAEDVGSGRAKAAAPIASSSSSTAHKPKPKPSDPFANYTTAASLGYVDPDAERLAAEAEIRRSQGVVGEWAVVTPPPSAEPQTADGADSTADGSTLKREAEAPPDDEDMRVFKLRKKTLQAGLGEIYDPGTIPIKVKPKKKESEEPPLAAAKQDETPPPPLKWNKISLKAGGSGSTSADGEVKEEENDKDASTSSNSKWAKPQWTEPIPDDNPPIFCVKPEVDSTPSKLEEEGAPSAIANVKEEDVKPTIADEPPAPPSGLFKKRKAPAGAGRGRKPM